MDVSFGCRVTSACLLLVIAMASFAQQSSPDSERGLDLGAAVARSLESNPELIAFGFQVNAQQARVRQAGLKPAPKLGLLIENGLGSGDLSGFDGAETTLSLAWELERGKRERRIGAARAGVSLLDAEEEIHRLDVAAETARLFLDALALQERAIRSDAAVRLAEETAAEIKKRVEAARTPTADLGRAEAELARARLNREDIEHEQRVAYRRLASQWGDTQLDFDRVHGDLAHLPAPNPYADLLARVTQNPNLARYLSEQRLREAELRLAESRAKSSWKITAGIRRLELSNDHAFMAGITIPLVADKRNQGRVDEAHAQLSMTDANHLASRVRIETQLFAVYQELQHALHRAATLKEEILPRMEAALRDTEHAYGAGRYSYLELRVVQAELLNTRFELVKSSAEAHRSVIEIERLTGTSATSLAAHQ
ncbi:MAG: cobalt-zinc-cadmium efflux system outer membrane protein [Gammaproteobacteria bacterium]|jgi:cobalt-zinc-cadmium efflux system outer membrane protein